MPTNRPPRAEVYLRFPRRRRRPRWQRVAVIRDADNPDDLQRGIVQALRQVADDLDEPAGSGRPAHTAAAARIAEQAFQHILDADDD